MRTPTAIILAAATLAAATRPADACLWDRDTFQEEALAQKDVAEVVSGKLRKHSRAFYEAKVTYTRALIDAGGAPKERHDDLAVALARLGKHDEALAVLAAKDKLFPGEYTTEANLGTVLAMKGDVKGALAHLEQALVINPDAHFGREKYQVELLRRALAKTKDRCGNVTGLPDDDGFRAAFVLGPSKSAASRPIPAGTDEAITAMVGLIRFGTAETSAVVWYNLGVALAWRGDKHLAVRALRRAERLGHPCAVAFGTPLARTTHALQKHPSDKVWSAAAAIADDAWTKGEAWEADRQRAEDAEVKKNPRKAFGY
ncbi:MAG TPA: tetratricopeptide repeat protein [Kofleriaceae bacterium]|nr:tetratricopeptide repeat protein [Kofleriaceae bacterium]